MTTAVDDRRPRYGALLLGQRSMDGKDMMAWHGMAWAWGIGFTAQNPSLVGRLTSTVRQHVCTCMMQIRLVRYV